MLLDLTILNDSIPRQFHLPLQMRIEIQNYANSDHLLSATKFYLQLVHCAIYVCFIFNEKCKFEQLYFPLSKNNTPSIPTYENKV